MTPSPKQRKNRAHWASEIQRVQRASSSPPSHQAIADELGLHRSYVTLIINDPDGSIALARRERDKPECEACGGKRDRAAKGGMCFDCHWSERRRVQQKNAQKKNPIGAG